MQTFLRNTLFLILITCNPFTLFGQITVTNSVFPEAGDLLFTSRDPGTIGTMTPPSATAQTWDFSIFNPFEVDTTEVFDAATGANAAAFPDADIILPLFNAESYVDNDGDSLVLHGFFGDPGFGIPFLITPSSPSVLLNTPLTYGATFEDDFSFGQAIDPADFPQLDSLLPAFPPIDSIRFLFTSHREDTVDAFGLVQTYFADFDVLRVKSVDYTDLFIEFKVFGLWLDPSGLGIEIPFGGPDTSYTYDFRNDVEKEVILSMNTDEFGNYQAATYKVDPNNITSIFSPILPDLSLSVFPNPTDDHIQFQIGEGLTENLWVHLQTITGQQIKRQAFTSNQLNMNVESVSPGIYFGLIVDESGKIRAVEKIIIH